MKRIYTLDLAKIIGILLITLHHFQQLANITYSKGNFFGGKINFGYIVELFFIISGYIYESKIDEDIAFKKFMKNKILRFYPFIIINCFASILIYLVWYQLFKEYFFGVRLNLWNVFGSITLFFSNGVLKSSFGLNNPMWYIGVLFNCYILSYIFLYANKKGINKIFLIILIILFSEGLLESQKEIVFFDDRCCRGYIAFFIGCILRKIYNNSNRWILLGSYFTLCLCTVLGIYNYEFFFSSERNVLVFIYFPTLIIVLVDINKRFDLKWVRIISKPAFQVYIWHFSLIMVVLLLKKVLNDLVITQIELFIWVFVIYLISYLFYFACEIPITKVIKRNQSLF